LGAVDGLAPVGSINQNQCLELSVGLSVVRLVFLLEFPKSKGIFREQQREGRPIFGRGRNSNIHPTILFEINTNENFKFQIEAIPKSKIKTSLDYKEFLKLPKTRIRNPCFFCFAGKSIRSVGFKRFLSSKRGKNCGCLRTVMYIICIILHATRIGTARNKNW
jgi:hypothetical protein